MLCTSTFLFLSFSFVILVLLLLSKTQKDQKYFCSFSLFASLVFIIILIHSLVSVIIQKPKKILFCLLVSFCSCFKFENPKIFVVLLRFCKVCCRVQQSSVAPLELGYHSILFKPHKWKSNNDDLWQFKLWWEAGMNSICFHFCTYTHPCEHA